MLRFVKNVYLVRGIHSFVSIYAFVSFELDDMSASCSSFFVCVQGGRYVTF